MSNDVQESQSMVQYPANINGAAMTKTTNSILSLTGTLAALTLAACTPDANSETLQAGTSTVSMETSAATTISQSVPFLTLRNKTGDEEVAKYFGGERGSLTVGTCELSRKPINSLKSIAEKAPFYIPDEVVKLNSISESSIEDFWRALQQSSGDQPPTLYMHGFYISFERGCKRASLLKQSLGLKGRFLLFSWPSAGAILDYTQDEADLYWSVAPLRGVLDDMLGRFGAGNVNLVSHSLGTRGVMLALVLLAQSQPEAPLFNQVVFVAPDIDAGIFEQYLPMIRPLARNMTVYVSSNDSPLALSQQVHGQPRLGEAGDHLQDLSGVEIIDVSHIPIRVPSGHVYHLYQNSVAEDMVQLLHHNLPAAQRENLKQIGENLWRLKKAGTDQ